MKYKKGKRTIKKVVLDGITFDSSLEVYCYKQLKEHRLKFEYHAKTYTIVPPFTAGHDSYEPDCRVGEDLALKSDKMQGIKYTPDFESNSWIIETKGRKNESFPMRWKLFRMYLTEQGITKTLYMPKNKKQVDQTIALINEHRNT